MAHPKRTVYDLLAKKDISEVTATQLDASVSNTRVDKETIEFWKGPLTIHRVLEMRTYPHGLPIPELGAIGLSGLIVAGGESGFKPEGSGIWAIMGIEVEATGGTPAVVISLEDSATGNTCLLHSGSASTTPSSFFPWESPLMVTNSLGLLVSNGDAIEGIQAKVAYQVVSQ